MSGRSHPFSHIVNLKHGNLVLDDPFATPSTEGSLCCYDLRRVSEEVLSSDPREDGLRAWQWLLPFPGSVTWPNDPLFALEPCDHPRAEEVGPLHTVHFHRELATTAARTVPHGANANLGTWGNPFRIEAYKILGLALRHGFPTEPVTLVVDDPCGELLMGLITAAAVLRHFRPDDLGLRIILVQVRPINQLCDAFEGSPPDFETWPETVPRPPETVPATIARGLHHCLGTAIVLDEEEAGTDPFVVALEKLVRGRFLDEEDAVFLLSAPERLKSS